MSKVLLFINRYLLFTFLFLIIISCSSKKEITRELVFFPAPPDTARIQYLMSINVASDLNGGNTAIGKYLAGRERASELKQPFGITSAKNKIFVIDIKTSGVNVIDLQNNTMDFINKPGAGFLKYPTTCYADTSGNLFIVDAGRKEVIVYDYEMNYKNSFGAKIFNKPGDVIAYNDKIYVSDIGKHKIHIFSKENFEWLSSFPDVNEKDTAFVHQPTAITIKNDVLYVTDFGEFHVKKFDMNGNFIGSVGSYGDSPGQFKRPKGIAVDNNNFLYVVEAGYNNLIIFNSIGQLMMYFGGAQPGPGYLYAPIRVSIDYENLDYFRPFVDSKYDLKYVIYVTNQFGGDKLTVYGFIDLK